MCKLLTLSIALAYYDTKIIMVVKVLKSGPLKPVDVTYTNTLANCNIELLTTIMFYSTGPEVIDSV